MLKNLEKKRHFLIYDIFLKSDYSPKIFIREKQNEKYSFTPFLIAFLKVLNWCWSKDLSLGYMV